MGTQSGNHTRTLQIERVLAYSGIRNKSFRSAVLSAPLYSTDLIDGKCLKVNFLLQTSYNLDINRINNSRKDIFTLSSMCNNDQKGLHFYDYLLMSYPYLLKC